MIYSMSHYDQLV